MEVHHNYCYGANTAYIIVHTPSRFYKLDNSPWKRTGYFYGIPSGSHTVSIKNNWGAIISQNFVIVGVSSPNCK